MFSLLFLCSLSKNLSQGKSDEMNLFILAGGVPVLTPASHLPLRWSSSFCLRCSPFLVGDEHPASDSASHLSLGSVWAVWRFCFSCLVAWVWLSSWFGWRSPKLRWLRWMLNLLYFQYNRWRWFFSVVVKFSVVSGGQVLWMVRWWLQVVEFWWRLLFSVWLQWRFRRQFREIRCY